MVRIENLRKVYGRRFEVLKGIDLHLEAGKLYALMGPNGSGKTTLSKCILGLINSTGGKISYKGQNVFREWQYRKELSYMPQIAHFPEHLSIKEFLHLLQDIRQEEPDEESWLKAFNLEGDADKKLGKLSGGMRQKVNVIQALMFHSELMICDEPTVGLDAVALQTLKEHLMQYVQSGGSILFVTHITPLVEEMADELIFLQDGHILYSGSPAMLKEEQEQKTLEAGIAQMVRQDATVI